MTPLMPMEWMAPLMFGGLVVFMLVGYPVAFSLAALGLYRALPASSWAISSRHT